MVGMSSMMLVSFFTGVVGHGYLSKPLPRGIKKAKWDTAKQDMTKNEKYADEPQSMGATGAPSPIPICGRLNAEVASRSSGDPLEKLTPGAEFEFEALITAHHMGHMTVRLCPLIDSSWTVSDLADCTVLTELGNNANTNRFWWLDDTTGLKKWKVRLPTIDKLPMRSSGASGNGVFTIQWRWNTANSCCPQKEAYDCHPMKAWCTGECQEEQDKCEAGTILGLYSTKQDYVHGNCDDHECCSEVFTNCADVAFEGLAYTLPADDTATAVSTPAAADVQSKAPSSGGANSGGANSASKCVAKGGWASSKANNDWCAVNKKCGGDGGDTCDCSCSAAAAGASSVEHKIWPKKSLVEDWNAMGYDTGAISLFCKNNKDQICDDTKTSAKVPELCDCEPVPAPVPEPEPENSKPEPQSEPEPAQSQPEPAQSQPEPEPEPAGGGGGGCDGPCPCDDGSQISCKSQCSNLCNNAVATNQCWGTPRYIHCKCTGGEVHDIKGCECENSQCPSLAQINATVHSTKFSRHAVQSHHALAVDSTGRTKPLSFDDKN